MANKKIDVAELYRRLVKLEEIQRAEAELLLLKLGRGADAGFGPAAFSAREAYEYVGLAESTFHQRVREGKISPPRKDGTKSIYLRRDLDRYLSTLSVEDP